MFQKCFKKLLDEMRNWWYSMVDIQYNIIMESIDFSQHGKKAVKKSEKDKKS